MPLQTARKSAEMRAARRPALYLFLLKPRAGGEGEFTLATSQLFSQPPSMWQEIDCTLQPNPR